jgi:flagellar L-ring protein precursor FlgH
MKNVKLSMTAAALIAVMMVGRAVGQDEEGGTTVGVQPDGTVERLPDSVREVRPTKEAPPAVTTTPTEPTRGSLFKAAAMAPVSLNSEGEPVGSAPVSFTSVSEPRPKKFKKNDLLTIIVQEDSAYTSNAQTQSEKQQDFDLALQNWIQLHGSPSGIPNSLTAVGNAGTLPEAKFKYDNNRQNQATDQRTDSLSLRIEAMVVDVKPNGTVVVEATKQITADREVQIYRLSGICRAEDVTPDNTVLSSQLAGLTVSKQTKGEVKDGVQRGWLNGLIDKISPF